MVEKFRKYFVKHKIEVILVIVIVLVASYFRLYKISDYMTFLGDEGRDAIVAKNILQGDLTLLGPRASAGDFFLGPVYYYMMAPFLFLSNYDPVGPAIMVALFGIATVFLVYYVGKNFFGVRAALIAAFLYTISPVVIAYSRSSWNPNPMPFFSLLTLYLLYLAVKNSSLKIFFIVGFLLGLAMQLHYLTTFLGVIVFIFVVFGYLLQREKKKLLGVIRSLLIIFSGFLVGLSPFLLFEVRHGFPNIRTITSFITVGNEQNLSPSYSFWGNIWEVFYRLFARLVTKFPPPEQVNITEDIVLRVWMIATILLALASIVFLFKLKDKLKLLLIGLWLFFGIFLFAFYKKNIYDYYFGFMFPIPFLLVGNFLSSFFDWKKYKIGAIIALGILGLLIYINLSGNPFRFTPNKQKDQAKFIAEYVLSKTNNKPFNFALLTRGNSDHVYRYFFEIANRAPVTIENVEVDPERRSVTDQLLVICEYQECQPLGNSLWEVAGFGRAEIAGEWDIPFVKVYRLVHYHRPQGFSLGDLELNNKYENETLRFSFKYPDSFSLSDKTSENSKPDKKTTLSLIIKTPNVQDAEKSKQNFDWKGYSDNTITIYLSVYEGGGSMLEEYMKKNMQGPSIDGKTPVFDIIRPKLIQTNVPKNESFVYEGTGGGEDPKKIYYFKNQDYIYYMSMIGGTDTGAQYTQEAEKLFDEIVKSIEFK